MRFSPAPVGTKVQFAPPSRVCSAVPPFPTAQPLSASVNHTALRSNRVLLTCRVQVSPASVVARISPTFPTAQPWRPSGSKYTPFSCPPELLTCANQPLAAGSTSTRTESLLSPTVTINCASPSPTPVARPEETTVQTAGEVLVQLRAEV